MLDSAFEHYRVPGALISPRVRARETNVGVELAIRAALFFQSAGTGLREAILLTAARRRASFRFRSFFRRRSFASFAVSAVAQRKVQAS